MCTERITKDKLKSISGKCYPTRALVIFQLSFVSWIWVKGLEVLTLSLDDLASNLEEEGAASLGMHQGWISDAPSVGSTFYKLVTWALDQSRTAQRQARVSLLSPLTQGHTGLPLSPLLHSPATRGPSFCSDQYRHLSNAKLVHLWILKLWNIILCSQTLNSYGVEVCHWPFNRYWLIPTLHPILCHTE